MGWSTGGDVLQGVLEITNDHVEGRLARRQVMRQLIELFEEFDCDVIYEVFSDKWPELEEVYWEMYPDEE
jgi:hypothetical protein